MAGPAVGLGGDAMNALQQVMQLVAAREPGALQATPGANEAIWRITDDLDASDIPDAVAILQAAGVPPAAADKTYAAPHFPDPNSANLTTQALSPTGQVLPPLPAPVAGVLPPPNPSPTLSGLQVQPRRVLTTGGHGLTVFSAQLTVTGAPDNASLTLTRTRGKRTITVARHFTQTVSIGQSLLWLIAHGLTPGAYRLVVRDPRGQQLHAVVTVIARPKSRRRSR